MKAATTGLFLIAACLPAYFASPISGRDDSVKLDGVKYVNKGLVGFGRIPSDFKESTGDTLGGIGSAIAFKRGTWTKKADGTYTGTLVARPDRGYNVCVAMFLAVAGPDF